MRLLIHTMVVLSVTVLATAQELQPPDHADAAPAGDAPPKLPTTPASTWPSTRLPDPPPVVPPLRGRQVQVDAMVVQVSRQEAIAAGFFDHQKPVHGAQIDDGSQSSRALEQLLASPNSQVLARPSVIANEGVVVDHHVGGEHVVRYNSPHIPDYRIQYGEFLWFDSYIHEDGSVELQVDPRVQTILDPAAVPGYDPPRKPRFNLLKRAANFVILYLLPAEICDGCGIEPWPINATIQFPIVQIRQSAMHVKLAPSQAALTCHQHPLAGRDELTIYVVRAREVP